MTEETTVSDELKCGSCGHRLADHGSSGCADDDEAAMGGCGCTVTVDRPRSRPPPPFPGPYGTAERPFA